AVGLADLGPEVGRSGRTTRLAVSLVAGGELLGALVATGTRELDLGRAAANQAAVAIKKIQVLERLTEKNLIKDFFEDLASGRLGDAVTRREGGVLAYDELGPYKYLLRIALDPAARDSTIDAVGKLAEYDRERGASLLTTLEEFLHRRGNISATSDALYVHPNTLRQRLRRIADLTGIDLRRDDWLMVEIAVKMVRLRETLGTATPHT